MVYSYGYKQQVINNLNNIDNETNNFYNYKGLNFLSKLSCTNKNIVIGFHGAVAESGTDRIIFRGFDWDLENTDILCICDYMLNKYPEYRVNWTLSTKTHNIEYIYEDLFTNILSKKQYEKVIFTGSSAGGFPSIKFACKFNAFAIVANSQLYLEKYSLYRRGRINEGNGIYGLLDIMDKYDDTLLYNEKMIEYYIQNYKPKQLYLYQNIIDTHHYKNHFVPFKEFILSEQLDQYVTFVDFTFEHTGNLVEHNIRFPNNQKHQQILEEFIRDT